MLVKAKRVMQLTQGPNLTQEVLATAARDSTGSVS